MRHVLFQSERDRGLLRALSPRRIYEMANSGFISIQADTDKKSGIEKSSQKKMKQMGKKETDKRGVVLLSHIPNGFYEPQMFSFFSQFGRVTRLKLLRSKKTGKSRHFAFVEFQFEEVAKIVADTMNNYLMFQKILKCKLIPLEDIKANTFKNWQYKYHVPKMRKKAIFKHNRPLVDPEKVAKKKRKAEEKRLALQKKLESMGIDYDVCNIKVNASFVPPERTRATSEDITRLRMKEDLFEDGCFSDFDDDEDDNSVEKSFASAGIDGDAGEKETHMTKDEEMTKSKEPIIAEVGTQDEDGFGVMVVDLDDSEVTFKTPPANAKIQKKTVRMSTVERSDRADTNVSIIDEDSTPRGPTKRRKPKRKKVSCELHSSIQQSEKSTKLASTPAETMSKKKKNERNTDTKVMRKKPRVSKTK